MAVPPQFLKDAATNKLSRNMHPPKKKGKVPPQFQKKVVVKPSSEEKTEPVDNPAEDRAETMPKTSKKETKQSSFFEDKYLQKNPSKQTPADKKRLKNSPFQAAAQRKLGK